MTSGPDPGQRAMYWAALLGGALAVLTPLLVLLPVFDPADPQAGNTSAHDAGKLGEALAALLPACAAGIAGVVSSRMLRQGKAKARYSLMAAAMALLLLTIFTAASVGRYLIGPAVLLMVPALWLQPGNGPPAWPPSIL